VLTLMLGAAAVTGDLNENRTLLYVLGIGIALHGIGSPGRSGAIGGVGGPHAQREVQPVADDVPR
jgi:hypothetical protein